MENHTAQKQLTPEENAVYDRQLRVWGIHVQKQLQKAKVLIVGNNVLVSEVSKNVVLAGVGSVTLFAGSYHFNGKEGSNFLANCYHDLPPVTACTRVLQEMNPLVTISEWKELSATVQGIQEFDLLCMTGGSLADQTKMNAVCREANVKFCCARCSGPFGWMFFDLLHHEYTSDNKESPESRVADGIPLDKAFSASFANLPKKLHPLYLVLRSRSVAFVFEEDRGSPPGQGDHDAMCALAAEQFPDRSLDQRTLRLYLQEHEEFPPVASLIGGMIANDVVKIVSSKGDPVENFMFYDIFDGKGILHLIK